MTKKILEAFQENKNKFITIENLSKEIQETIRKKGDIIRKIAELHNIVFTNFNTERKETPIKIKSSYAYDEDEKESVVVFINKDGISLKHGSYSINTDYISKTRNLSEFVFNLKQIKQKENELLPLITNPNKQLIFKQFFEDVNSLSYEQEIKIKLNKELHFCDDNGEEFKVAQVKLNPQRLVLDYSGSWTWNKEANLSLGSLGLKDKLIIEQIYDDVIGIIREYYEDEKVKLEKTKQVFEDLKLKFSKQLIINSLKEKMKGGKRK